MKFESPTASAVEKARNLAGVTKEQAAELVCMSSISWYHWERGTRKMPYGLYELFLLKTNQPVPTKLAPHDIGTLGKIRSMVIGTGNPLGMIHPNGRILTKSMSNYEIMVLDVGVITCTGDAYVEHRIKMFNQRNKNNSMIECAGLRIWPYIDVDLSGNNADSLSKEVSDMNRDFIVTIYEYISKPIVLLPASRPERTTAFED
jgi:hypothetical protein